MHELFYDVETRSVIDLRVVGHHKYAAHEGTEILRLAWAADDKPVQIWRPGDRVPGVWHKAARDADWISIAHHAAFEDVIQRHILGPRYSFPEIPIERRRCSMTAALSLALPGGLDACAAALDLPGKDQAGHRLMLRMSRPRKERRGEDPSVIHWYDSPEDLARLESYNASDVETTRAIWRALPPLPARLWRTWQVHQAINDRGVAVDLDLVKTADKWARRALSEAADELAAVTGEAVTTPTQLARLGVWCRAQGVEIDSFTAESVGEMLARDLPPAVRQALEIRQQAASASVKKYTAIINHAGDDGRLRGLYRCHGAATGRASGIGVQPQNLRRLNGDDPTPALARLAAGNYRKFQKKFPNVLDTLGSLARPMFIAAPGHKLIGGDFSLIEIAVLAWLSDDTDKIEALRKIFAGEGDDLHAITASRLFHVPLDKVTPAQRSAGKIANFACQYGGGVGAIMSMARKAGVELSEAAAETLKTKWRLANPKAVQFWARINKAAVGATFHESKITECGRLSFRRGPGFLYMRLPSSRKIVFPRPRLIAGRDGEVLVSYHDNAGGRFALVRNGGGAYGGLFTENAVSGVAFDLLDAAMRRIDPTFPIILHTHDEITSDVPAGSSNLKEFKRLMQVVPSWAVGCPIACEVWTGMRYLK